MMVLESAPPATTAKATLLRGSTLYMLGEQDAACRLFLWGVRRWPLAGELHNNLGLCSIRCCCMCVCVFACLRVCACVLVCLCACVPVYLCACVHLCMCTSSAVFRLLCPLPCTIPYGTSMCRHRTDSLLRCASPCWQNPRLRGSATVLQACRRDLAVTTAGSRQLRELQQLHGRAVRRTVRVLAL